MSHITPSRSPTLAGGFQALRPMRTQVVKIQGSEIGGSRGQAPNRLLASVIRISTDKDILVSFGLEDNPPFTEDGVNSVFMQRNTFEYFRVQGFMLVAFETKQAGTATIYITEMD